MGSRLDQLEAVARDNLAEARSLVAGEGPSTLRTGDLGQALARLVEAQHRDGRRAALSADLPEGLPRTVEATVLRTVQEALSNVARHSGVQEVLVSGSCQHVGGLSELVIEVVDDGVGADGQPEGTGLTGVQVPRVVVLTTYDTDGDILRAVEAGAIGYLLKDCPREDILAAVRAVAVGHGVLSPAVTARLMEVARGSGGPGAPGAVQEPGSTLSPRERQNLAG
ncbi:hypothetical protein [Actinomyces sp.]|uniref:hypothetical protein n=1 Tax=Actinomyces sp. TaxID=29317 RepID=UPI0034C6ACA4